MTCNTVSNVCIKSMNYSVNLFNAELFFSLHILQISDPVSFFTVRKENPFFSLQLFLNPKYLCTDVNDCSYFSVLLTNGPTFHAYFYFILFCFIPFFISLNRSSFNKFSY